ncbi:DNA polymerase III subunit delta [Calycomorphotria hydatis]|uniref:DNA polymerase III subunit delta n=2 Tax=Calycomorphotria hydatis TaxID=2528027 RepID=A0A517TBI1_9PLAN|nr:DNA polymerase III subunit delta [Calycomorphotria hydatis]
MYGDQRHLKQGVRELLERRVLGEDEDAMASRFAGDQTDLTTILDEVSTLSMWSENRFVIVEDAEKFVSNYRAGLEKYVANPAKASILLLDVASWPKNTKLAKAVAKIGMAIECKALKGVKLFTWLRETAKHDHDIVLGGALPSLMVEMAGEDLGLLDMELAKISAYMGDRKEVTEDDVTAVVGGWRAKTTFEMLAAVREGDMNVASSQLDALFRAGEAPQRILGGITFTYRRVLKAVDESAKGTPLGAALKSAGVFPKEVAETERYLRKLGRPKVERFRSELLRVDEGLKGGGRLPERVELERLLVVLAGCG